MTDPRVAPSAPPQPPPPAQRKAEGISYREAVREWRLVRGSDNYASENDNPEIVGSIMTEDGWYVARVWAYVPNAGANAALLAAAPDLLEALDRLTGEVAACWGMGEVALRQELGNTNYATVADRITAARAAIAKATVPLAPLPTTTAADTND